MASNKTKEDNYLAAAYNLLVVMPKALQVYVDRNHHGGFIGAIIEHEDNICKHLTAEQWVVVKQMIGFSSHEFHKYYDKIKTSTILDKSVLDVLITKCVMTREDQEEILKQGRQSERNGMILNILASRPYPTFDIFIDALKSSEKINSDLANEIEEMDLPEKDKVETRMPDSYANYTGIDEYTVKLQKNYHKVVNNMSCTSTIIDRLVEWEVLEVDDSTELFTIANPSLQNRKLLEKIKNKDGYIKFLNALREDDVNAELADGIESTVVTENEIERLKSAGSNQNNDTVPGIHIMMVIVCCVCDTTLPGVKPPDEDETVSSFLYRLQSFIHLIESAEEMEDEMFEEMDRSFLHICWRLTSYSDLAKDIMRNNKLNTSTIRQIKNRLQQFKHDKERTRTLQRVTADPEDFITQHIRDKFQTIVSGWKKEEDKFVLTKATKHISDLLKTSDCVVLTGDSGSGKTTTIQHLALQLHREQGYEIIPLIMEPDDVLYYCSKKKKVVFVLDDIGGSVTVNVEQVNKWARYMHRMEEIFDCAGQNTPNEVQTKEANGVEISKIKHKILISCNSHIFKDKQFRRLKIFTKHNCNLMCERLRLSDEERLQIITKRVHDKNYAHLVQLLPKMYVEQYDEDLSIPKEIEDEIREIRNRKDDDFDRTCMYCALCLCVIFGNSFKEIWLFRPQTALDKLIMKDVCSELGIRLKGTAITVIEMSFSSFQGTLMKTIGDEISMIHDTVYDIAAALCGEDLLICFIKHAPSTFIGDRFRFAIIADKFDQNCIKVPEDKEEKYFERLMEDLEKRQIYSTLHNKQLMYESYRTKLLNYFRRNIQKVTTVLHNIENTTVMGHIWYNDKIEQQGTLLMEAASEGHPDIVNFLIDTNCNVKKLDKFGKAALHFACEGGHLEVAKNLLKYGADILQCNSLGRSPLYEACTGEHSTVVEFLLENNANIAKCDDLGQSPLYVCCKEGYKGLVEILLRNKADITQHTKNGKSPLYAACQRGHTAVVDILLEYKPEQANIFQCDKFEDSPLYVAFMKEHAAILELLLRKKVHVIPFNKFKQSPLYWACRKGHKALVEFLLRNGADISQVDKFGLSPLHGACEGGNTDIAELLLQNKADTSQCDIHGRSPLYEACRNGHTDVVCFLLEQKADVSQCNCVGQSPLYRACADGHTGIVNILLQNKADITKCNKFGESPLHVACKEGHTTVVEVLLMQNSDILLRDKHGKTALDIARQSGHQNIVTLLNEYSKQ